MQRAVILILQAVNLQVRQPPSSSPGSRGEQQSDTLGQQPPGHERQHLRGRPIQPRRVIDQAQQRPLLGCLRQQGQHRQPGQKPIRHTRRGLAAGQPGLPALARRLTVGYQVAMAATMGYMLVMMLVTGN